MACFCLWIENLISAMDRYKKSPEVQDAQRKSGMWGPRSERHHRSGLTAEEFKVRKLRRAAKKDRYAGTGRGAKHMPLNDHVCTGASEHGMRVKEASAGSGRGSKRLRESDDVTTGASEHGAAWSGRVAKRFRVTDEVGTGASDHDVTLKKASAGSGRAGKHFRV